MVATVVVVMVGVVVVAAVMVVLALGISSRQRRNRSSSSSSSTTTTTRTTSSTGYDLGTLLRLLLHCLHRPACASKQHGHPTSTTIVIVILMTIRFAVILATSSALRPTLHLEPTITKCLEVRVSGAGDPKTRSPKPPTAPAQHRGWDCVKNRPAHAKYRLGRAMRSGF